MLSPPTFIYVPESSEYSTLTHTHAHSHTHTLMPTDTQKDNQQTVSGCVLCLYVIVCKYDMLRFEQSRLITLTTANLLSTNNT